MFIYLLTNTRNGKFYVGKWQGRYLADRWNAHISSARRGSKARLARAIRKYGPEAFVISTLRIETDKRTLALWERIYITLLSAQNTLCGYNVGPDGDGGNRIGAPCKQSTRDKLSRALRGRFAGVANPFFGRKHTAATRACIVAGNATRDHRGAANYFFGKRFVGPSNAFFGKTHTEASLEKMRRPRPSLRGRKQSPEHVAARVAARWRA